MPTVTHHSRTKSTKKKSSSAPVSVPGFVHVRTLGGVDEYLFKKNGLRVLLKRETFAPVATVMVTYLVGSVNEHTGQTGLAHMLEHMMFKESANFRRKDKRDINELLDKKGARLNASTWVDRTNYYETVALPFLEDAIALEADRMRHAIFDAKELASEMTVVRNEYEITRNSPERILSTDMHAAAFQAHPYHHPTIGWLSDITSYTVEKLVDFYDTYYRPDNAVVSVVGDIDPATTLRFIKTYFGVHAKSKRPIPVVLSEEPVQEGERRVSIVRPGTYDILSFMWKKPPAMHPDIPALIVLASMLGGGHASVLFRALVDTGLASDVSVSAYPFRYESGFEIMVTLAPGVAHPTVETIVMQTIDVIKKGEITETDIVRAQNMLKTAYASEAGSTASFSDMLCEAIAGGDWSLAFTIPKRIATVTREDVLTVARTYISDATKTVGQYHGQS